MSLISFLLLLCNDQPLVNLYYLSSVLLVGCCQNLWSQLRSSESSSEEEGEIKLLSCFLRAASVSPIVSGSFFLINSQLCHLTFEPFAYLARLLTVLGLLLGGAVSSRLQWDAWFSFLLCIKMALGDSSPSGRKPWKLWIFSIRCITNCADSQPCLSSLTWAIKYLFSSPSQLN